MTPIPIPIPIPIMLPREYATRSIMRGVTYWVLIHIALVLVTTRGAVIGNNVGEHMIFSPSSACAIAITIGMLAYSEVLLRRESIFVRNLGVSRGWLVIIPGSIGMALELAVWIGMRAAS